MATNVVFHGTIASMIRPESVQVALPSRPPLLAEAGFMGLLLLLLVTLHPFMPPTHSTLVISAIEPVATDASRQISFTAVFLLTCLAALLAWSPAVNRAVPWSMAILLGWCLLSAVWSDAPGTVFRRAALITEVSVSALLGTALLGPERAFARLRLVLLLVLAMNWIAIPILPAAIHQVGELDPKLVGNWRGLYDQKNVAGAVCALTILAYFFPMGRGRRWSDWLVIAAAAAFLFMTKSKTSMSLLPVAVAFGLIYRKGWKTGLDRALLATAGLLVLLALGLLVALNTELITRIMQDPDALTGRTEIWQADIAYLKDHFALGAGFEAVFGTGGQSPLANYLHGRNWVADVSNSHNGYLEIFLGLGAIGFVLSLLVLVVIPFAKFWPLNHDPARDGYFAIFIFIVCHNFTEADFLAPDGVLWMAFLMVLSAIKNPVALSSALPRPLPSFLRLAPRLPLQG